MDKRCEDCNCNSAANEDHLATEYEQQDAHLGFFDEN